MKQKHLITLLALFCARHAFGNAITNGDFQTGSLSPATTGYSTSADMIPPETWTITSFDTRNPFWADFFDHTTGDASGRFMAINGSDSGAGPAWSQQISVSPDTLYSFGGWFASVNPSAPAALEFRVRDSGGLLASHSFQLSSTVGVWGSQAFTFSSGSASALTVQVWDVNFQFQGNDYAIDDLAVNVVPEPSSLFLIGLSVLIVQRRRR